MMRWLAAGLWGLSAAAFGIVVAFDSSAQSLLWPAGVCLALAVLIGLGGRIGLVGAVLGAGIGALAALASLVFLIADTALYIAVPSAILAVVSGLAARELARLRAASPPVPPV